MKEFDKKVDVVATHDGQFHADDVVAGAILRMFNPGVRIIRTRDPKVLDKADIVFDVGMEFDPERGRYDHHQREKAGTYPNGIEYSSAGLVWDAIGIFLVDEEVHRIVSQKFIMPIDAHDNGQQIAKPTGQYEGVYTLSFSGVIASLNKQWFEEEDEERYEQAVEIAKTFLLRAIYNAEGTIEARATVKAAIDASQDGIIILEQFVPWQESVHTLAKEQKFIVFPGERDWMVQAIPVAPGSFQARKSLPPSWGGLKQEELALLTGIQGVVFCHPKLFICGAKTKEDALALARIAVGEE